MPSSAPPVLTKSGVVPGNEARLPHFGIEGFVSDGVVRTVVFQNAEEYHTVVARCRKLNWEDLVSVVTKTIWEQEKAAELIKWWTRYSRVDEYSSRSLSQSRGSQLKEIIRYYSTPQDDNSNTGAVSSPESGASRTVVNLSSLYFYTEANSPFSSRDVPLPETVLPGLLQDAIGITDLMSDALQNVWFNPLPVEIFAEYIARHDCLNAAKPEDDLLRVQVLTLLCREFMRRTEPERAVFGGLCWGLLSNRRCLPFDSDVPDQFAADFPGDLYLYSAELKAFDGFGSFCKVAGSLQAAGMTDNFLLTLGVRKSVSIDFLLTHLDTLKWNQNPKALIEYLRTASLTKSDLTKLITTKYLSAAGDSVTSYAPGELYLPNKELRILPFVRTLAWPEPEVTENSDTGKFLTRLGMKTLPTLAQILLYLSDDKLKDDQRFHVLDFVCDRLVPHGAYYKAYGSMPLGERVKYRFLPCVVHTPFGTENASISLQSPVTCFTDSACAVMCFPVINPALGKKGNIYGTLFQCESEPRYLLNQLVHLVAVGKGKLKSVQGKELVDLGRLIELSLKNVFKYLSHKCADFNYAALDPLSRESFIPCVKSERVIWYRPDEVFFSRPNRLSESLTEELFHVIDFSPFLAAAGVKEEATTKDLFQKMIESPASVLQTLGSESKYRSLLRRIAADPPFSLSRPSAAIRNSPFLLAYAAKPFADEKISSDNTTSDDKMDYHLAKADDIFVIDNSNFGRMFPVFRAPPETDLEDFYVRLGAHYISKSVDRRFEVVGKPTTNTSLTNTLRERLAERGPLLVSPNITSRPLVSGAASILDDNRLEFFEASNLLAVYTLGKTSRRSRTTCFSRPNGKKNSIFVTADFDLFDAGQAIGDLIFVRCQLEDAFFISSLLETPLHQLRARGFPVDRVIKPMPAVVPIEPKPKLQDINNGTTVANLPTIPKQRSSRTSKADILDGEFSSQKHDEGLTAAPDSVNEGKTSGSAARPEIDAKADMLKQMFPDADPDFIAAALGLNPDEDDIKELADKMANGHYPKKEVSDLDSLITEDESKSSIENVTKKKTLRNRLGRAFGGKRGNNHNDSTPPSPPPPPPTPIGPIRQNQPHGSGLHNSAPTPTSHVENRGPVSPAADAQSQNNLERMLERSVGTSNRVRKNDMDTLDSNLTSIPPDLDRGQTCEVLPGHSLKPFPGPRGNGLTHNGILVFSSKVYPSSEIYLTDNAESLRCFADVLDRLCAGVFSLNLATVAIYHDPAGVSIAFNSNRSTHYNFRFFHGLHWLTEKHNTSECYSYWYVTICHELAHHFVSGHTREHGFYCENFSQLYMPKLLAMLRSLGID